MWFLSGEALLRNGINLADGRFDVQVQLNIETRTSTAWRVGH